MSDHARLFVGVRLAVPVANALAGAAETLARRARDAGFDIRWVAPVGYHVTLAFLGNTRVDTISAVRDVLDEAVRGQGVIELRTRGVGAFPSVDKARVVWAGVEDAGGPLGRLAERVRAGVARLGYGTPGSPFHAHVTLGRVKEAPPKLASLKEVVLPLTEQMFGACKIDHVTLFESETKSNGSVYREVHRAAFKAAVLEGLESQKRQTGALGLGAPEQPVDAERETDDGWPRGHDQ